MSLSCVASLNVRVATYSLVVTRDVQAVGLAWVAWDFIPDPVCKTGLHPTAARPEAEKEIAIVEGEA
jgi:hypothetical protein